MEHNVYGTICISNLIIQLNPALYYNMVPLGSLVSVDFLVRCICTVLAFIVSSSDFTIPNMCIAWVYTKGSMAANLGILHIFNLVILTSILTGLQFELL